MQTRAVNIHREKCDIYCGRGTPYGNPFRIGKDGTREEVIAKYKKLFLEKIAKRKEFKIMVLGLKGKRLGCSCKPKACHVDIIVEWLNNYGHNN